MCNIAIIGLHGFGLRINLCVWYKTKFVCFVKGIIYIYRLLLAPLSWENPIHEKLRIQSLLYLQPLTVVQRNQQSAESLPMHITLGMVPKDPTPMVFYTSQVIQILQIYLTNLLEQLLWNRLPIRYLVVMPQNPTFLGKSVPLPLINYRLQAPSRSC